jgi:methylmalonyl-CoA mutase cobalamin-binding domain/chain
MDKSEWKVHRDKFLEILLNADSENALLMAQQMLEKGIKPEYIFENCITPTLEEIGNRFEKLEIYLPEMIEAAEIVEMINQDVIEPKIKSEIGQDRFGDRVDVKGKILLATVQGDLHDIGKSMVALMLRVNGFKVYDIGIDVSPTEIVDRAQQVDADIIGLSSLLTTCLPYMKDVVDFLEGVGIRRKYAVIIGGAAVTPQFADEIGADAYGRSAAEAAIICDKIMNSRVSSV